MSRVVLTHATRQAGSWLIFDVRQNMMRYTDKKPGLKRVYTLTDDSLLIEATKWFGSSFRLEFALDKVKPLPDEHRVKDDTKAALVGLPGFVVFFVGAITGTAIYEKTPIGFYSILGSGLAAMLLGFVFGGRIRVLIFKSREETPLFDVADRGQHEEFDAFITELKARICATHAKADEK